MPACRTLPVLAAALWASLALAADPVKLKTLNGEVLEGELVSIDEKEVVLQGKGGPVSTPADQVLEIEGRAGVVPSKFIEVELVDQSVLRCESIALAGKDGRNVKLKTTLGMEIELPLDDISHFFRDAQDSTIRQEWRKRVLDASDNKDGLFRKDPKTGEYQRFPGTFGYGCEDNTKIEFQLGDNKKPVTFDSILGIRFARPLKPNLSNPVCKVHDAHLNVLACKAIQQEKDGYVLTTLSGAQLKYKAADLSRIDFSFGRLAYLDDLRPSLLEEKSNIEGTDRYRAKLNPDGNPIRMGGRLYTRGISMHAYTAAVYDLGGDYNIFKAVVGPDDQVPGDCNVRITILGDNVERKITVVEKDKEGKETTSEVTTLEFNRKTRKQPVSIAVDIRRVNKLKIVVESNNLLEFGDYIIFADPKVSK